MLISDSPTLATFCSGLQDAPYVAVDTEFVRERTYYAQLALIQIAHGDHAAAIDPLAPGIDLGPLESLMANERILKVFHSGTEDLELLLQNFGALPIPIYDTQVAASLCGDDAQIGYARLVKERLGLTLDKGSQRTDWSRRPLSTRQLDYALADVTHLCRLYEGLVEELESMGRTAWAAEEMIALSGRSRYELDPNELWRRVRIRRPKRRTLAILRGLAAWREHKARSRNLPRPWVLKNDAMVQLAQAAPETREALERLSTLKRQGKRWRDAEPVLQVIKEALALPEAEWPTLPPEPETEDQEAHIKALRSLLSAKCSEAKVAPAAVATRRDLESLVSELNPDLPVLRGWRRELFGDAALALLKTRSKT